MKTSLAVLATLALPLFAQASPPQKLAVGIERLSCVGTNGLKIELEKMTMPGEDAIVSTQLGFLKKDFTAVIEQADSGDVSLALDSAGVNYKVQMSVDLMSTDSQQFTGTLMRYTNAPVALPATYLVCRIRLM
jgi:hypothetical protein